LASPGQKGVFFHLLQVGVDFNLGRDRHRTLATEQAQASGIAQSDVTELVITPDAGKKGVGQGRFAPAGEIAGEKDLTGAAGWWHLVPGDDRQGERTAIDDDNLYQVFGSQGELAIHKAAGIQVGRVSTGEQVKPGHHQNSQ